MKQSEISAAIAGNPMFAVLDDAECEFLAGAADIEEMHAGHVVFRQGDKAKHFYLILEGEIAVEVPAIEGPTLELQHLRPGQVLGWSWLIPPYEWAFMARADAPAKVIRFDGEAILARCETDTRFGYHLLKAFSAMMSERLGHARRRMMEEWQAAGFG